MDEEKPLYDPHLFLEPSDVPDYGMWEKDGWIDKKPRDFKTDPFPKDMEILRRYFELRPTVKNDLQALVIISSETGRKVDTLKAIVQKCRAREEAKRQRREYADAIYAEKIPMAKAIVSLSLNEIYNFVSREENKPKTWQEAKDLAKIATDMNGLLRLELGQSTQNLEVVTKTDKTITVLMEEIKQNDPFVDYDKE